MCVCVCVCARVCACGGAGAGAVELTPWLEIASVRPSRWCSLGRVAVMLTPHCT